LPALTVTSPVAGVVEENPSVTETAPVVIVVLPALG
jgi:hypothetical protein